MRRAIFLEPVGPQINVEAAHAWGEIVYLFPRGMPIAAHNLGFTSFIIERLNFINYHPLDDAFVVAGKLSKVTRAALVIYNHSLDEFEKDSHCDGTARLLFWSEPDGTYQLVCARD